MGIVGIIAWPLGWAAASIGTSNLIDIATEQELIVMTNVYGLQTILAGAIIGAWIILTTHIAPVVIQYAISSGAQVGSALLGGTLTAGAAAASTGATTAATLGASGVGTAGIVAGGAASAAGSIAGASMQGGGPALSGSTISHLARPWWSMPKSSTGSSNGAAAASTNGSASGGDSPASATVQATTPVFNPSDPANSRQADEILERSRGTQKS